MRWGQQQICNAAHPSGFPYEGKLSPEVTDEVDNVALPVLPHLIRPGYRRSTFPS